MKIVKLILGIIAGFPIGVLVIIGAVAGIAVAAFQGGFNIIAEKWLDVLNEWVDV